LSYSVTALDCAGCFALHAALLPVAVCRLLLT
jgi:hypothetical protein